MSIKLVKLLISIKWTKILLVHAIKRVKRHYEIGICSIFAYPIFISLMHFSLKIKVTDLENRLVVTCYDWHLILGGVG